MRTFLHAIGLLAAGYGLAVVFLAVTRPSSPSSPRTSTTSPGCSPEGGQAKNPFLLHVGGATTTNPVKPRTPFWELYEPAMTDAVKAANRTMHAHEFDTPAQSVPAPLQPLFFLHQPTAFVQAFRDCEADQHCYVTYHHVPKTGGTTVESALASVFRQADESSCCGEWNLHNFYLNVTHYCDNKFTAWQMDYDLYFEVLDVCLQRDPQRRVLMLVSIREPISTTLSFIHQRCNKNFDKRKEGIQEACQVCRYEEHTKVWDRFADKITEHLAGAWHVLHVLQDDARHAAGNVSSLPTDRLQVAVLEPNDIDAFLHAWHPERNFTKANPEILTRCYFRMTKEYIDKLSHAAEWYRRFVAGVV